MDLDQRIEALTQSVELLSQMHQDNEKKYTGIFEAHTRIFETLGESLHTLTKIAGSHEQRITDLEKHHDTN